MRQVAAAVCVGVLVLFGIWSWMQTTKPFATPELLGAQITSLDPDGSAMMVTTWRAPRIKGCVRQGIHLLSWETTPGENPAYYTLDSTLNGDTFSAGGFVFDLYENIPRGLRDGRWTFIYRIYYGCGPFYAIPWAETIAPLSVKVEQGHAAVWRYGNQIATRLVVSEPFGHPHVSPVWTHERTIQRVLGLPRTAPPEANLRTSRNPDQEAKHHV